MPWLSNWFYKITHKDFDLAAVMEKIQAHSATRADLLAYVDNLEYRIGNMVQTLQDIYKKYDIVFKGFRSFNLACDCLRQSIKDSSEEAYNSLIKIDSMITSEQQRHVALIKMAVTKTGKRVFTEIQENPEQKTQFAKVFGEKDSNGKIKDDGIYQRLWSEIHRLSEYLLIEKDKVHH